MPDTDPIRAFAALMGRDDDQIDLAKAALLIARTEYPQLDLAPQMARLDRMADGVAGDPSRSPLVNIRALNHRLFDVEGLRGNEEEYDDPRNSFLNDVLERKKGIPITLSLVYTEVARRSRLPVVGVGFPGHFLVKYLTPGASIVIDPYHCGVILTNQDCVERLKQHFGEEAKLKPEFLDASTPRQILARMLNNLKGSYFRRRNYARVLTMIEMSLAINPDSGADVRDRGMVHFTMGRYSEAAADLKAYLSLASPTDPQLDEVRRMLHRIRALVN
jgi:regulator of sirC expression with transglutaminase-like and TPR domain